EAGYDSEAGPALLRHVTEQLPDVPQRQLTYSQVAAPSDPQQVKEIIDDNEQFLTSGNINLSYDTNGAVTTPNVGGVARNYGVDPQGRVRAVEHDGVRDVYVYDVMGRRLLVYDATRRQVTATAAGWWDVTYAPDSSTRERTEALAGLGPTPVARVRHDG